ncbi:hypothetical protein [Sediminibacterium sp.]|uniref:hypothetical protein n=1 Tax=Sediminibacterium sp. TaxID=1917865 RepID=UPI0025FF3007|nr:hypothetical protein [Sediminibacterium sp.]MBT9485326.1 hypothetical protein [Sediminibacterium sp.]
MFKSYFFILLALCSVGVFAQPHFSTLTFEEAAKKADKENKLVMLVITSEKCVQCNDVAEAGLVAAKKSIDSNCILIRQPRFPVELNVANSIYIVPKDFFGIIWFDAQLNILQILPSSSTMAYPYIQGIQRAIAEMRSNTSSFKELKHNYYNKVGDFVVIRKLVDKVLKIGFEPHPDLIDELTQKAPDDSATAISFLQYVLRCAPIVGSTAQKFVEKQKDNYMIAWYNMPLRERQVINSRITFKSINKAIADKNLSFAYQVAAFRQTTFTTDKPEEGPKANMQLMLTYYKGVNDTVNYMRNVFSFYERYFMNIKPEDIRKEDSLAQIKLLKTGGSGIPPEIFAQIPDSIRIKLNKTAPVQGVQRNMIQFTPRGQFYANALNEGAWDVYTFSKNAAYLSKALLLAKRGLEFYESAELIDTYARLLYRTGNKVEAINWEEKAIKLRSTMRFSTAAFETVLNKMKQGEVNID